MPEVSLAFHSPNSWGWYNDYLTHNIWDKISKRLDMSTSICINSAPLWPLLLQDPIQYYLRYQHSTCIVTMIHCMESYWQKRLTQSNLCSLKSVCYQALIEDWIRSRPVSLPWYCVKSPTHRVTRNLEAHWNMDMSWLPPALSMFCFE